MKIKWDSSTNKMVVEIDCVSSYDFSKASDYIFEGYWKNWEKPSPPPVYPYNINDTCDRKTLRTMVEAFGNQKIEAIKMIRRVTGLGLKEGKDFVENNIQ